MTSLVVRQMRSGRVLKLRLVSVVLGAISEGIVHLERVQVICPACGQQVEAVATDGRVKGYCVAAKQNVDFLIETQLERKKWWLDPEYRARLSSAMKRRWQDPEYRAKQSAAQSAARKKLWQDLEYRAKMSAATTRRHNTERGVNERPS